MVLVLMAAGASIAQTPEPAAPPPQAPPAQQAPVEVRVVDPPLAVRVVEMPKPPAPAEIDPRDREDKRAFGDQLLLYSALVVAAMAFLAIAFALQALYLGVGLRAMRRTAQQIDRNTLIAQRAFVYVGALEWSTDRTNVKISPIWANAGTTPTRRLRISTNWVASHGELAPDFDINYVRAPESLFLGPSAKAEFGPVLIPMRDIQAAIEDRLHLYVWGRATYDDMFEGSQPHFFDFCHRIEASGEAPGNISLRFTQFGLGNGADEDRRQPEERKQRRADLVHLASVGVPWRRRDARSPQHIHAFFAMPLRGRRRR
ncbi:MAG: hypothetical protein WCG92_11400, partial [Hyphomicrobiales bacterium]